MRAPTDGRLGTPATCLVATLAALLPALAGCPPPEMSPDIGPPPIGPDGATLWVELGTGTDRFVPIADGADLELVHGVQGGWHVDLTARIHGTDPEGTVLRFQILDGTGALVAETPIAVTSRRLVRDGWTWTRTGDIVILSMPDPPAVLGAEVTARVAIERDGVLASADERRVTIVDRL